MQTFLAMHEGYYQRLSDLQDLAVVQGYWSGYYMGAKHPKTPGDIIEARRTAGQQRERPDVFPENFLETERKFLQLAAERGVTRDGYN